MARPTVTETTARDYRIAQSVAFAAAFDLTVESFDTRAFTVFYDVATPSPSVELRRGADAPLNLLQPPAGGFVVGDYQILVMSASPTATTVQLTCNVTNNGAAAATDAGGPRGSTPAAASWRLTLGLGASTPPRFVASDPRAELVPPAPLTAGDTVTLSLTDATGVAPERTVV